MLRSILFLSVTLVISHLTFGQISYKGYFKIKKEPTQFDLISSEGGDTLKVNAFKKVIELQNDKDYYVTKGKRMYLIVNKIGDTIKVLINKKELFFENNVIYKIDKKGWKNYVLIDNNNNIILTGNLKEKKGGFEFNVTLNQNENKDELLCIATHHLYAQAKAIKESNESFVYFVPVFY